MLKERDAAARVADEAAGAVEDLEAELAAVRLAASKQLSEARREAAAAVESASAARSRCISGRGVHIASPLSSASDRQKH